MFHLQRTFTVQSPTMASQDHLWDVCPLNITDHVRFIAAGDATCDDGC